ncbi:MAG: hypothetical protein HY711_09420 [Candidatus Melainabacteria bacterium]|nr:hypothetical protein [Candidatus Melainabacteria bacterium]
MSTASPGAASDLEINGISVMNLCVMTIDEFEYFEGKVLSKPFSAVLSDYADKYKDRMISAGRYLANLDAEPNTPEPSMVTARNAIIDAASLKLFGRIAERKNIITAQDNDKKLSR